MMPIYSQPIVHISDEDIAERLCEMYLDAGPSVSMLEMTNASFRVDRGWLLREPNYEYIDREIEWYESQLLNIYSLKGKTPAIWEQVSDIQGNINSNYGWCVYNPSNGNQFEHVVKELRRNPESRRAVMYYTRPTMHTDQSKNGMDDHMCTYAVQYMIRNGMLDAHVYMRSNDAVFGYNNDVAWQKHVHTHLAQRLEAHKGWMFWNAGSLHVYPRHFYLLEPDR